MFFTVAMNVESGRARMCREVLGLGETRCHSYGISRGFEFLKFAMTWGTSMTETQLSLLKKEREFMSSHEKPNSDKGRSGADLSEDRDMGVKFFQISSDPCPTACFCLRRTAHTAQGAWKKVERWRGGEG